MSDGMMDGEVRMKKRGRPASKLSDSEVKLIRELRAQGMTYAALAKKFDVSDTYILNLCRGNRRVDAEAIESGSGHIPPKDPFRGLRDAVQRVRDVANPPLKKPVVLRRGDDAPFGEVVSVEEPVALAAVDEAAKGVRPVHVNEWEWVDLNTGDELTGANSTQVGGEHYKTAIQPWDYIAANEIGYFEGNIIKYVTRWKKKNGVEDLKKARHYLDKLIEVQGEEKAQ